MDLKIGEISTTLDIIGAKVMKIALHLYTNYYEKYSTLVIFFKATLEAFGVLYAASSIYLDHNNS